MDQLEKAVAEAERAVQRFLTFMAQTCRYDEGTAYQAGVDACSTDAARSRCVAAGQKEKYDRAMAQWRSFVQNPPNCPAPPPARKP